MLRMFFYGLLSIFILVNQAYAQESFVQPETLMEDLKVLTSDIMEGRKIGTPGSQKAREYIAQRFEELELEPVNQDSYFHAFKNSNQGVNVIGKIEGTIANKYIAITAHYDHLGKSGNKIYSGADDNASGVVGILALAQYFKIHKPKYSLLFIAFDGEEQGLQGSKDFVTNPLTDLSSILLNINLDMISQNSRNELYVVGVQHSSKLKALIVETGKTTEVQLKFGHLEWESQSDHYSFHKKGIPYLYFGVEDHEFYHTSGDKFETIPEKFFADSVRTILKCVINLDNAL